MRMQEIVYRERKESLTTRWPVPGGEPRGEGTPNALTEIILKGVNNSLSLSFQPFKSGGLLLKRNTFIEKKDRLLNHLESGGSDVC